VIHGGDFRTVEPNLLANFLTKMEEVDLSDMLMSTGQRTEFLSALKETNKIKRFSWQDNESEDRLAAYSHLPIAMKKIEKLTLKLNLEQSTIQSLFKVLAKEEASVKSLSLDIGPVDHINPVLLSGVVAKLEEVDLTGWKLTEEQCISICSALSDKPRLRKLICDCGGWPSTIEQLDMHVRIATALEELEMARFSGLHQEKMLAAITRDPGRLRKLVISHTNLGAEHPFRAFRLRGDLLLEGMVLSKLARKLVELDLGSTSLKAVQLEEFMVSVARSPGKLKNLILQGNDLERVDAGVIARMATKIESLNIAKTELSSKQAEEIFKAIADSPGVLKDLNMDSNDLREVDSNVMADALNKLEKVWLSDMPLLTQGQMRMILTQALEKGTALKELSISLEQRALSVFQENENRSMYNKLFLG